VFRTQNISFGTAPALDRSEYFGTSTRTAFDRSFGMVRNVSVVVQQKLGSEPFRMTCGSISITAHFAAPVLRAPSQSDDCGLRLRAPGGFRSPQYAMRPNRARVTLPGSTGNLVSIERPVGSVWDWGAPLQNIAPPRSLRQRDLLRHAPAKSFGRKRRATSRRAASRRSTSSREKTEAPLGLRLGGAATTAT
jgi:hypothetical protein